jgi:hypothetical protein
MVDLKPILGKLIEQLPSVINELSPEEFKVVQDTLNLARERVSEELVSEEDRIPKGAEFLYLLAGGDPKAFAKYAKQVPDANINRIAANKTTLENALNKLQGSIQISKGEEAGIPQAGLQSSTVYGFKYSPKNKRLFVKFQGDGVYKYDNVPSNIARLFMNGAAMAKTTGSNRYGAYWRGKKPSLGAALNQHIKNLGFPYQKIS